METKKTTKNKLRVIEDYSILGRRKDDSKLYMILWERIANNGVIYCWADSEEDAYENFSYKLNENVRHTIVEISPYSMPVTDGRRAL